MFLREFVRARNDRAPRLGAGLCALALLVSGCGSGSVTRVTASPMAATSAATAWVEEEVSFRVDGMTVYGTWRHPARPGAKVPAALIIAGSGPTDRDGNSAGVSGIDTYKTLAGVLSAGGVASLRYDKLGSGKTGLGPYASKVPDIGIAPFEHEATAALDFLSRRPGTDKRRLTVIGHSEGALFALLLATKSRSKTHVHRLGLLEPLSRRYLDLLSHQITTQINAQQQAGKITDAQAATIKDALARAVASLRANGTVAANLPGGLSNVFSPANAKFLSEADRQDPAELAARLKAHTPVLLSCSDADIQVSCDDVEHLAAGLAKATAATDFIRLTGINHVLKEDPSRTAAHYTDPLPFSSQLKQALPAFARAS
ncbi:alpha/beta hydrolase [Nonomuraea sp. NPDC050680]|uniref:alpha/beta hydrolase n=1 Tax=Nonomuraea sp. NPDC050680 TaxID=3154630 RepID=UPI0033D9D0E3